MKVLIIVALCIHVALSIDSTLLEALSKLPQNSDSSNNNNREQETIAVTNEPVTEEEQPIFVPVKVQLSNAEHQPQASVHKRDIPPDIICPTLGGGCLE